jgi:hypothetical protein
MKTKGKKEITYHTKIYIYIYILANTETHGSSGVGNI